MEWKGRQGSSNVEDRRGSGGGGGFGGGPAMLGGGLGGVGLIIALLYMFITGDTSILGDGSGGSSAPASQSAAPYESSQEDEELKQFVSVVLADTERVWTKEFQKRGADYRKPTLVLFTGSVQSGCGAAGAATGPFYCPADEKLYIDLSFFRELRDRFRAPGDFAMAYVVAHEVGHHVQKLIGISEQVDRARRQMSKAEYNQVSVRVELQADYFAGVWAKHERELGFTDEQDLGEALNAASQIGDDRLQTEAQGYAVPESFTHGTSEQRKRWLFKGYEDGTIEGGNTFKANSL